MKRTVASIVLLAVLIPTTLVFMGFNFLYIILDDSPCHLDNFICSLIFISLSVAFFIVADLKYTPAIVILWVYILIYGACIITDVPKRLGYFPSLALNGIEYITNMVHRELNNELRLGIGYVIVSVIILTIPFVKFINFIKIKK